MSASRDKARDARRHDFFVIDNEIITEHAAQIGVHAVAVYCALVAMADGKGQCWPAHATIAKQLGMSRRGVQNALAVLEDAKLLGVRRRPTGKGMAHKTSIYTLLPVAKVAKSDDAPMAPSAQPYGTQCATPMAPYAIPMAPSAHEQDPRTRQEDICEAATAAVAAPSPMQTTQSAHAVEIFPPSTPTASPWMPLALTMASDLEGRPGAARTKAGTIAAFYGQLVGVFGAKCNDDPTASADSWRRFVSAMKSQRMKDGRPVWSIIRKSNVLEQAGRWLADNAPGSVDLPPGHSIDPVTGRRSVNAWVAQ